MKIREISFFMLLALIVSHTCSGKQADSNSLLWRISSKDLKKPSYLFGTIHMICKNDYIWTPVMQSTLETSEAVCFEMDLDDPAILQKVTAGMYDNTGKKLRDYFSEEDYNTMETYIRDSIGVDISGFQGLKPVALQSMFAERELGCGTPVSYEGNILEQAKKDKKEVLGLEKAEEQLDLFDNLPADTVAKQLMEAIRNGKADEQASYTRLVSVYKKQDLRELYRLMQQMKDKDFDMGGFIDARNEKWIPRMIEKMDKQSVFFAVGAGHLWGNDGLIALLRKAGYKVEPIK
jgi:uncharacterized protein YbaP (TraB family)